MSDTNKYHTTQEIRMKYKYFYPVDEFDEWLEGHDESMAQNMFDDLYAQIEALKEAYTSMTREAQKSREVAEKVVYRLREVRKLAEGGYPTTLPSGEQGPKIVFTESILSVLDGETPWAIGGGYYAP